MIAVKPKVFFLGEPKMHLGTDDDPGVVQWLRHLGGEEALSCLEHDVSRPSASPRASGSRSTCAAFAGSSSSARMNLRRRRCA